MVFPSNSNCTYMVEELRHLPKESFCSAHLSYLAPFLCCLKGDSYELSLSAGPFPTACTKSKCECLLALQ